MLKIALIVNIILNYCLIFGNLGFPTLGVKGAALATVIARTVEFTLITGYVYFIKKDYILKFTLKDFKLINKDFINMQSMNKDTERYWYTHKNLHAACSLLLNAMPDMFHFLDDKEIPRTSNSLENYFKHLKEKLLSSALFQKRQNNLLEHH